ncbi:MAG: hypothetical protein Q4E06_03065 [Lautropia sp.]|nr:hypothetical protein [Lautropia sp.]
MTDTQHSPAPVALLADSALVVGMGLLALAQLLFAELAASLPEHAALAFWAEFNQGSLRVLAGLLSFGAVALVPGLWQLWRTLGQRGQPVTALAWTGLTSTSVITAVVAALFAGKLAFTPYAMALSAEATEIACGLIAGSLHLTALALGAGMILTGLSGRRPPRHPGYVVLSVLAGVAQLAGAWPWLVAGWVVPVASLLMTLWAACTLRALGAVPTVPALRHADDDEATLIPGDGGDPSAPEAADDAALTDTRHAHDNLDARQHP